MLDQATRVTGGLRIRIEGSVQGVGFRPWVHRLATGRELTGRVWNDTGSVTIEAFGADANLGGFLSSLEHPPMPAARIVGLHWEAIPDEPPKTFCIVPSLDGGARQPSLPPDLALCPDCRREILDPDNRRHLYAFTNCTRCGPRYTVALDVPWDRERTTMAPFPMCEACRSEYEDVRDRRFHAEPVACPDCGPRLSLLDADGCARSGDPILEAAQLLRRGLVVAIKGLGGYHLACDASSEAAVSALRSRKRRYAKPFAVMVASIDDAERVASLTDRDRELLVSAAAPIVLVERRASTPLAAGIAPGIPLVGLLLPYTPLHELILRAFGAPLVMTSGNLSDEPMFTDDAAALAGLGGAIADALLVHDRAIAARCDDSVARVIAGDAVVLRRGRGWVPASVSMSRTFPQPLLACGAHLKNAFCLAAGQLAWMGPHIGDLETHEACAAFDEEVERFSRFVGITPEVFVHDLHPGYFTTRWARSQEGRTCIAVQHHHAHVAAAMAEHGLEGPVLGLAWDGTGDGGDGTAWGGELLAADHAGFRRLATLRPLHLAGGDVAIREVWRIALALVDDAFDGDPPLEALRLFDDVETTRITAVRRMLAASLNCPAAHGAGRYFDAIGALALALPVSQYEGEVATRLAFAADPAEARPYDFGIEVAGRGAPAVVDLRPAVRAVVGDLVRGLRPSLVSGRFHATLAAVADDVVAVGLAAYGTLPVVLSGGCFQNERLATDVSTRLLQRTRVYRHRRVPPNDGGIALGQAVVAAARLRGEPSAFSFDVCSAPKPCCEELY